MDLLANNSQNDENTTAKCETFQSLLMRLATAFINVPHENIDHSLNEMLKTVGSFTGVDRTYIFVHDHVLKTTSNTHEWCNEDISPEISNLQKVPFEYFLDMLETWRRGETVNIKSVFEMPEESPVKDILLSQGIKSVVLLPLMSNYINTGFVGFDSVRKNRTFADNEIALLQVMAEIISNAQARQKTEAAIKESETRFRNILSQVPNIAVQGYRMDGTATYWNEASEIVYGYKAEEALGKNLLDLIIPPQMKDAVKKAMREMAETGKPIKASELVLKNKGGSDVEVFSSHAIVVSPAGEQEMFCLDIEISEQKKLEKHLRHLSYHDNLTGLYNRYYMKKLMGEYDENKIGPFGVILADLNGLKLINDSYSSAEGDKMLKSAAGILEIACPEDTAIGRWGGDEFLILLPWAEEQDVWEICRRINLSSLNVNVKGIPISLTLGVAAKTSKEQSLNELLRLAEDNMYKQKLTESRSVKSVLVTTLLRTLAEKSFETEAHTRRMQHIAQKIGEKLGLNRSEMHRLDLLITLHDIGKISIDEHILTKQDNLTSDEWHTIKRHPEIGYRIAMATTEFVHVAEEILSHHERWDGSGYPRGLKEEEIPLLARIASVADACEVMSNGRPYKKAMTITEIAEELKRCAGKQFDPAIVAIVLSIENSLP